MYKFTTFDNRVYYSKYFPMDFKIKGYRKRDLKSFMFSSEEEAFDFMIRNESNEFFGYDFTKLAENDKLNFMVPHYIIKSIQRL